MGRIKRSSSASLTSKVSSKQVAYKLVYRGYLGEWVEEKLGDDMLIPATADDVVPGEERYYMKSSLNPNKFYRVMFHYTIEWSTIEDLINMKKIYVRIGDGNKDNMIFDKTV